VANSVAYGWKWSQCTLWLHLAFYSEAEKNREKISEDSRSTGQYLPNGKEKMSAGRSFVCVFACFRI
jgi:hypothetical protein